jgi:hypothetical protein
MSQPMSDQIVVNPDRVIDNLRANPLGSALFEAAQWRTAYEEVAEHARRLAAELQTTREALDAATSTPPSPDQQTSAHT